MEFSTLLSIAIFVTLLLLPIFVLLKHRSAKQLPPGPPRWPIIGNLHQLGELPHVSLSQMSKKYGPVMLVYLGGKPTVIISSAQAAKEVLKTHDVYTCNRSIITAARRLSYNCRDIAFAPNGDYHREMKKICVLELLNPKRVQSVGSIREEEVASLIDSINELSFSSTPVDLSEKTMSLSANITCREAFGKSFRDRGNFQDIIHEAFVLLGSFYAADFFPYVGWIVDRLTGLHSRLERSFKELDGFLQQVIDDHIYAKKTKQEQDYEDIVDVLLKLAENGIKSHAIHITQDHIKGILMDLFLAGIDTSAITLVWAMTELVRKPRIMKKAQEEIRAVVGEADKVSESDLDHFEYLEMVVKETLRLHPPGPLLVPRETISDINLNSYHIHSKTRIQINAWAIARDSFGAGRRMCPGMPLAVARVELALANLLYCFDWKLPEGMKVEDINMEEVFGLDTYKKEPLLLVPVKYRPDIGQLS